MAGRSVNRSPFTGRKQRQPAIGRARLKVRKGDHVMIMAGKDKGRTGKVIRVIPQERRIVVEGVNVVKRHTRAGRESVQGGIMEMEKPIDVSKAMLLCTKCDTPSRVGTKSLQDGRKVRVCKRCGEVVDKA